MIAAFPGRYTVAGVLIVFRYNPGLPELMAQLQNSKTASTAPSDLDDDFSCCMYNEWVADGDNGGAAASGRTKKLRSKLVLNKYLHSKMDGLKVFSVISGLSGSLIKKTCTSALLLISSSVYWFTRRVSAFRTHTASLEIQFRFAEGHVKTGKADICDRLTAMNERAWTELASADELNENQFVRKQKVAIIRDKLPATVLTLLMKYASGLALATQSWLQLTT